MMKVAIVLAAAWLGVQVVSPAEVVIDEAVYGESLGGWKTSSKQYAQYVISGTKYRSYRPEWTVTPDGGTYVSVRIDHVRGWFSSDDHAVLEITINPRGEIVAAQSNIAIQGRSISSDVIQGVGDAGTKISSIDRAVQIGTDLVANLSSKLLRTKMVEPGRVSFPSAVRHNYNLLYRAIRVDGKSSLPVADAPKPEAPAEQAAKTVEPVAPKPETPAADAPKSVEPVAPVAPPANPGAAHAVPLEIRNYDGIGGSVKPPAKKE